MIYYGCFDSNNLGILNVGIRFRILEGFERDIIYWSEMLNIGVVDFGCVLVVVCVCLNLVEVFFLF